MRRTEFRRLRLKGDAAQLIAEATDLLREIMGSGRKAVGEIDSKSMSPEQSFWLSRIRRPQK